MEAKEEILAKYPFTTEEFGKYYLEDSVLEAMQEYSNLFSSTLRKQLDEARDLLEYRTNLFANSDSKMKYISELEKEAEETDILCKKILDGKGTIYVRELSAQLTEYKEGFMKEAALVEQARTAAMQTVADNTEMFKKSISSLQSSLTASESRSAKLVEALERIEKHCSQMNYNFTGGIAIEALTSYKQGKTDK